jgi:hypothetical protein
VRSFQSGPRSEDSQKILNEISMNRARCVDHRARGSQETAEPLLFSPAERGVPMNDQR